MRLFHLAFLVFGSSVAVGCGHRHEPEPSPLGVLAESEIASLQSDCPTPLLDDRVCGGGAWTRDCDATFHSVDVADKTEKSGTSAIRRIACKPHGWALWTDPLNRIVAICADDGDDMMHDERMRRLVTKHRSAGMAQKLWDYVAAKTGSDTRNWDGWLQPVDPANPGAPGQSLCIEFRLSK